MIPYILAAVGGYLIGDSLKGKQYAKGGKMGNGKVKFYEGQSILIEPITTKSLIDALPEWNKYANKELVIEKIEFDIPHKKVTKAFVRNTGEEVPFTIYLSDAVKQYAEGGMMATGGKTESQEELLDAAIASKELKEKARKKIKGSDAVLAVGYTDYGGTFGDKVLIEYFKKNYPKNIVYERAGYNGQNAILFGEPVQEYLDGYKMEWNFHKIPTDVLLMPDFEDFYMEMQMELEKKEFTDFIKYLKDKKYKVSPNTLAWLLDNYQEIGLSSSIEPNGIDFSPERLEEVLIEEGLIKKL